MKVEDGEVTLMILREEKMMFPLNTYAFTASQSSKSKLERYIGTLIVYKDGRVKEIEEIRRLGYYGSKLSERISSMLFGAYSIETTLKNADISPVDLKLLIAQYLTIDSESEDPTFELEDPKTTADNILRATSITEAIQVMGLPGPLDCLDVL